MKFPSSVVYLFFICFIFFFIGFFTYTRFFEFLVPDIAGIKYLGELTSVWDNAVLFSVITAFIPAVLFITWGLIPLYSIDKKIFTVLITIICISIVIYIRYKILFNKFNGMVQSFSIKDNAASIVFSYNDLNYEYYFGGGLIIGCIISYLAFHNKIIERRRFYS